MAQVENGKLSKNHSPLTLVQILLANAVPNRIGIATNFAGQVGSGNVGAPDISGTNVVWSRMDGPLSGGALKYNVYSNFTGQLTSDGDAFVNPAISGTNVVWVDLAGGPLQTNFGGVVTGMTNFYNYSTGYSGLGLTTPDISGTTIVWNGPDMSGEPDMEIYMATYTPDVVPAPGALVLVGLGAGLVGWLRRRRTL